jgi:hypothetical protein
MRVVSLLLCFLLCPLLAGCLATSDQPPAASAVPASTAAAPPPAPPQPSPASRRAAGSGGGPRGGASTAAAQGEPEEVPPDPVIQARTDCWMAVEHQKGLKGLDQRIAFVDKCVADKTKIKP